ncbi:MAG: PorP/SprF family type IX secretion system membrane protein [Chitinophagales bacterium]
MKKYCLLSFLAFLCLQSAFAQQDAQYTQYMFNTLVINPAYAGSREAVSILGIYRNQWTGFDGSPTSIAASVHSPIGEKLGLGLFLEADKIGVHQRISAYTSYAYKIAMGSGYLSLGLQAGVLQYTSDWSELPDVLDPDDPNFAEDNSKILPNFGLGVYYYTEQFFIGASVPHLLDSSLEEVSELGIYEKHYWLTAGIAIPLSENLKVQPSLLVRAVPSIAPVNIDANVSLIINDIFRVGVGYRSSQAALFMLEFQQDKLRIGYSYDLDLSGFADQHSGTHEIMVGLDLPTNKLQKVQSPRFF